MNDKSGARPIGELAAEVNMFFDQYLPREAPPPVKTAIPAKRKTDADLLGLYADVAHCISSVNRYAAPAPAARERKPAPPKTGQAARAPAKRNVWKQRLSGAAFYLALIAVVAFSLNMLQQKGGAPRTFFGYSALSVLTRSMQSEIPQGSFVLVKAVDPESIQIGDDVTYMVSKNASITHEVIAIFENYQNSGQRYFQTKGVDNEAPDPELVAASNVLGRVVFHTPAVGRFTQIVSGASFTIFIAIVAMGVLLYLTFLILRWMIRASRAGREPARRPQTRRGTSPRAS